MYLKLVIYVTVDKNVWLCFASRSFTVKVNSINNAGFSPTGESTLYEAQLYLLFQTLTLNQSLK